MGRSLTHTIGTDNAHRFTVYAVDFDGAKTRQDLTGAFVYFELERDGVKILDKDNDPADTNLGITILAQSGSTLGQVDVQIEHTDLALDTGGTVDYGLIVRLDPAGADDRHEPIRGTMEIVLELVDVP